MRGFAFTLFLKRFFSEFQLTRKIVFLRGSWQWVELHNFYRISIFGSIFACFTHFSFVIFCNVMCYLWMTSLSNKLCWPVEDKQIITACCWSDKIWLFALMKIFIFLKLCKNLTSVKFSYFVSALFFLCRVFCLWHIKMYKFVRDVSVFSNFLQLIIFCCALIFECVNVNSFEPNVLSPTKNFLKNVLEFLLYFSKSVDFYCTTTCLNLSDTRNAI